MNLINSVKKYIRMGSQIAIHNIIRGYFVLKHHSHKGVEAHWPKGSS